MGKKTLRKSSAVRVVKMLHRLGLKNVEKVIDATSPRFYEVTKNDDKISRRYDHNGCALAVCAKRTDNLDGAVISRSVAYLAKGKTATRYVVNSSVGREVVSFDRGGGFEPGTYQLSVPSPGTALGKGGSSAQSPSGRPSDPKMHKRFIHVTKNARFPLGRKNAA